jgi:hypothetical protein
VVLGGVVATQVAGVHKSRAMHKSPTVDVTQGSLLLSLFHLEAGCHVSRNTSRDWYADTDTGPPGPQLCRHTRLPDSDVYQEHRGQRRPTPLAAGFTREAREGAAKCTSTHYTRPSGSSPRLQAVRAIPASNETMRGVVTFDNPLEEQVAAYPGLPRDTAILRYQRTPVRLRAIAITHYHLLRFPESMVVCTSPPFMLYLLIGRTPVLPVFFRVQSVRF